MRHFTQPTKTTCGPTCVAMILEKSPKWVLSNLKLDPRATSGWELRRELKRLGVGVTKSYKYKEVSYYPKLSIVMLRPKRKYAGKYPWGHWIVRKGNCIYDPQKPKKMKLQSYKNYMALNDFHFTSFMMVTLED